MDALLIVDMQNACITNTGRYKIEQVAAAINELSALFRSKGLPVIHIQHEEETGDFVKGQEGWHIAPVVDVKESDITVGKTYCDGFIKTSLKRELDKLNVERVVVTGCATDFCVDSTIKGAISHGYDVVVPSDAHTTSDRPHIEVKPLIEHFNWNWANLITVQQKVTVVKTHEVLEMINH